MILLLLAWPIQAHPLTDLRLDRTAAVRLSPEGLEVHYTLEVSPLALHLDAAKRLSPAEIASLDRTSAGYVKAYAANVAVELQKKLRFELDGERLPVKVTAIDAFLTDHAVCRFTLHAGWPPGPAGRTLTVADGMFEGEPGILNLTIDRKGGGSTRVDLVDVDDPPLRVRTRSLSQLSEEDAALARKATAVFTLPYAIAPYPRVFVPGSATSTPAVSAAGTAAIEEMPEPTITPQASPPDLFSDLARRGLPALFDSTLGVGVLLLAAFLFGAAHAFTPGHGKTLVAAYLVGERGTVRHAVLLAVVTTVTHTGSVIAVAAILWSVYGNNIPGRTQGGLQFIAGFFVLGVGLWLLLRRLTGQADHFHIFGGHHHHGHSHSHSHSHDHDHHHDHEHCDHHHHDAAGGKHVGWLRLVLMGLGGGIVPCWDAVLLLVAAAAMNRVGFAIPLLLAFSAGLGAVLVALGIGVVYAYRAGASRFQESRWFQVLPTISAVFLVCVGFWLCKQAVGMAMP